MRFPQSKIPDYFENIPGDYWVANFEGYGGDAWYVIRKHDLKLMSSSARPNQCLRWVNTWGEARINFP